MLKWSMKNIFKSILFRAEIVVICKIVKKINEIQWKNTGTPWISMEINEVQWNRQAWQASEVAQDPQGQQPVVYSYAEVCGELCGAAVLFPEKDNAKRPWSRSMKINRNLWKSMKLNEYRKELMKFKEEHSKSIKFINKYHKSIK